MIKVFCVIYLSVLCNAVKYPSELPRCKFGDVECIKKAAQITFKKFLTGYPSLNMPAIDPLHVNEIFIKQGAESPVNIELTLKNGKLHGFSALEVTKFVGFTKDPNGVHEIHFKLPQLVMLSDYSISGRVLILPIQGEGKSNLTVDNLGGKIKFRGKQVTKSGKDYMKVENFKLSFTTTRLYINFENLFKGDKLLGDSTNLFLNESWQDIFDELKANIFDAFGQVFENLINVIFARIPYNELFIE